MYNKKFQMAGNKPLIIIFIVLLIITNSSCAINFSLQRDLKLENWFDKKNTFAIWAMSDTHVADIKRTEDFKNAIEDINMNLPGIDMAIVSGDVVDRAVEQSFKLYLKTRESSYIKDWHEIIGSNHDFRSDGGQLFRKYIRENVHYTVQKGNLLFIFMSDSGTGVQRTTGFSDELFNWWKEIVINNQDKIIVVVTHPPLKGSGIFFSSFGHHHILNSERFTDLLEQYRIDIWLSGHLHMQQSVPRTIVTKDNLNGAVFIHISSIIPNFMGIKQSESRTLTFVCGSRNVLVRSRNHKRRVFNKAQAKVIELSKPFECED